MNDFDPVQFLDSLTADPKSLALIAGPIVLLLILVIVYIIVASIKSRKEISELEKEMCLDDTPQPDEGAGEGLIPELLDCGIDNPIGADLFAACDLRPQRHPRPQGR